MGSDSLSSKKAIQTLFHVVHVGVVDRVPGTHVPDNAFSSLISHGH